MHHGRERAPPFEIRRGDVHLRTDHPARIDQFFDFEIGVRNNAARGANRRNAESEIKPRKTDAHVRIHRWRPTHRKEHVVVHSDESRQHCVTIEIERLRIRWYLRSRGRLNRLDLSVADDDRLIVFWSSARAVNHTHMRERDQFRVSANELPVRSLREDIGNEAEQHDKS